MKLDDLAAASGSDSRIDRLASSSVLLADVLSDSETTAGIAHGTPGSRATSIRSDRSVDDTESYLVSLQTRGASVYRQRKPAQNELGSGSYRASSDDPKTEFTLRVGKGQITVIDANKNTFDITLAQCGRSVDRAIIKKGGVEPIAEISRDIDGLKYTFLDEAGQVHSRKLSAAEYDGRGGLKLITTDDHTIELRPEGSMIERNTAGKPIQVKDANGNFFEYKWKDDALAPAHVSIQGPMTEGAHIELKPKTLVDHGLDIASENALALLFFPPAAALKVTNEYVLSYQQEYKVYVNGQDKEATLLVGYGAGVNAGPASVGLGVSAPLQQGVKARVAGDGTLILTYDAKTLNGAINCETSTYCFFTDGTHLQSIKSGFWAEKIERVRYSRSGRTVNAQNTPRQ